jgi:hypothetical protein
MRDNTTCEEVFEADANARAEFEAVCEEERQAAIEAQDADMVAEELARQSDAQLAEDAALDLLVAAG